MKLKICENLRKASLDPKFTESHEKSGYIATGIFNAEKSSF